MTPAAFAAMVSMCDPTPLGERSMRPLKRHGVNKFRSAKKFRRQSKRTQGANMAQVMRGGIRF